MRSTSSLTKSLCSRTLPQHLLRGAVAVPGPPVPRHLLRPGRVPHLYIRRETLRRTWGLQLRPVQGAAQGPDPPPSSAPRKGPAMATRVGEAPTAPSWVPSKGEPPGHTPRGPRGSWALRQAAWSWLSACTLPEHPRRRAPHTLSPASFACQKCADSGFTVLAELRKCGLTDNENCLKAVTLSVAVDMVRALPPRHLRPRPGRGARRESRWGGHRLHPTLRLAAPGAAPPPRVSKTTPRLQACVLPCAPPQLTRPTSSRRPSRSRPAVGCL